MVEIHLAQSLKQNMNYQECSQMLPTNIMRLNFALKILKDWINDYSKIYSIFSADSARYSRYIILFSFP